jgi:hypothetical protein
MKGVERRGALASFGVPVPVLEAAAAGAWWARCSELVVWSSAAHLDAAGGGCAAREAQHRVAVRPPALRHERLPLHDTPPSTTQKRPSGGRDSDERRRAPENQGFRTAATALAAREWYHSRWTHVYPILGHLLTRGYVLEMRLKGTNVSTPSGSVRCSAAVPMRSDVVAGCPSPSSNYNLTPTSASGMQPKTWSRGAAPAAPAARHHSVRVRVPGRCEQSRERACPCTRSRAAAAAAPSQLSVVADFARWVQHWRVRLWRARSLAMLRRKPTRIEIKAEDREEVRTHTDDCCHRPPPRVQGRGRFRFRMGKAAQVWAALQQGSVILQCIGLAPVKVFFWG